MKKFGGLGKGVKGLAKDGLNKALNSVVEEIMEETKIKDIAMEKVVEAGKKILKDDSIPTKDKLQKEILKRLIKNQLGL